MTPIHDKLGHLMGYITLSAERQELLARNHHLTLYYEVKRSAGFTSFIAAAGIPTIDLGYVTLTDLGAGVVLSMGTIDDLEKVGGLCFVPSWTYIKSLLRL